MLKARIWEVRRYIRGREFRKLGIVRTSLEHPEIIAVAQYGRGIYLKLVEKK